MNKYEAKGISAMKLSWQSRQPTQATALQHLTLGYKKIKLKFLSAISGKSFEEILITHSQVELWPQEMEDHLRTVVEADPQPPHRTQHRGVGHHLPRLPTAHHRPYTFVLTSGPSSIYTRNIT